MPGHGGQGAQGQTAALAVAPSCQPGQADAQPALEPIPSPGLLEALAVGQAMEGGLTMGWPDCKAGRHRRDYRKVQNRLSMRANAHS